ncbi:MAG: DEAD/DEAH box helicase [Ardenticatenaceae bacterium]|nr:DEAD/DEAH box helicase [Ardenticatenaceae bacterium]
MSAAAVKKQIPHTWPLFFARYGRFTPVQEEAIPLILRGENCLVMAATASGKTEAVLAPLLEREWSRLQRPDSVLHLLYICPTRALVRDLYERLQVPLANARISLSMKTGDTGPVSQDHPPALLITTPESTDALLTRAPRLFTNLLAIVLDEIHLLDNTSRGDQLRCLLTRLARIRHYAYPDSRRTQRVALSATVADPAGVVERYLRAGQVVAVPGRRPISAEIRPLYDLDELVAVLAERSRPKSLLFCNAREEAERVAAYLQEHLPFDAAVFVHYSNLDGAVRRDVETRFVQAAVAICVTTSTLELGIDIGSVDDVVLLGVPPDLSSFIQRIGRGGRRKIESQVLCLPKSPGEWARFEALQYLAAGADDVPEDMRVYGFRPSVLVQQIFSSIKQNPTGAVRLADVARLAPSNTDKEQVRQLIAELVFHQYLQPGRLGEWRPDAKLQLLIDQHDIYSNIGLGPMAATAVDAYTGQIIAQTERVYKTGMVVLLGGRPMQVMWQDGFRFGLAPSAAAKIDEALRFQKSFAAIPYLVTQTVAHLLGIESGQMICLPHADGHLLFHFWGTMWGKLLTAVLGENNLYVEAINEYCLYLRQPLSELPGWDKTLIEKAAQKTAVAQTNRLEMGRFHSLLPAKMAREAAVHQLNLPKFSQMYAQVKISTKTNVAEKLYMLAQ